MGILDCPRHFVLLGCCSVVLVLALLLPSPFVDRFYFLFGLSGALHAFALVMSLQSKPPVLWRLGFVGGAAALSIAAPFGALPLVDLFSAIFRLDAATVVFLGLALTSAIGGAFYWLLIRFLWARSLPARSVLLTVGSCVFATVFASLAIGVVHSVLLRNALFAWLAIGVVQSVLLHDALLPMFWWLAFSTSLWIADRNSMAADKRPLSSCEASIPITKQSEIPAERGPGKCRYWTRALFSVMAALTWSVADADFDALLERLRQTATGLPIPRCIILLSTAMKLSCSIRPLYAS